MRYDKLTTVQNRFEADLLLEALERHGVECYLKTFEDTAYDGLFVAQEGWGVIWVADHDLPLARDILASFRQAYDAEDVEETD
jgi:hypothetical protein